MTIHRLDTTMSTNRDARGQPPWHVFVARAQTEGRGRLDHRWLSEAGLNLTFSAVVPAGGDVAEAATLPLVAGLAVVEALGDGFEVKWPNDVYFGGRKLCGILCERDGNNVIVGIGININQTRFPPAIADRATSLKLIHGRAFDLEAVLAQVLASLQSLHARWEKGGFGALLGDFAARDYLKNRPVSVFQTDADLAPVTGIAQGVTAAGALLVDGQEVFAGEVRPLSQTK